jgi:hypothetical protein
VLADRSPEIPSSCAHSAPETPFIGLSAAELESAAGPELSWLWEGDLAPGHVTLLTSQWQSGKTTLVSVLLSKLKEGGTYAGPALRPRTKMPHERIPDRTRHPAMGHHQA